MLFQDVEQLRLEKLEIDQQLRAIQFSSIGSMNMYMSNRRSERGYSSEADNMSRSGRGSSRGGRGRGSGRGGDRGGGGGSRFYGDSRRRENQTDEDYRGGGSGRPSRGGYEKRGGGHRGGGGGGDRRSESRNHHGDDRYNHQYNSHPTNNAEENARERDISSVDRGELSVQFNYA